MTDLRKAAEMALEMFDWLERRSMYQDLQMKETHEALRQALAHEVLDRMVAENERLGLYEDGPAVKTYSGNKPNYCTMPETFTLDRGCYERGCVAYDDRDGDGVTIKQERVDEMAKSEHDPVAWMKPSGLVSPYKHGSYQIPLYTAPPKPQKEKNSG